MCIDKATLLDYNFFDVFIQIDDLLERKKREKTIKVGVFLSRIDDV